MCVRERDRISRACATQPSFSLSTRGAAHVQPLLSPQLPPAHTVLAGLALSFSLGLLLQGAACYANYWPLLSLAAIILVPMASLVAAAAPGLARWLHGFSLSASAGVVLSLWHSRHIPGGAAALQLAAGSVLVGTWGAYERLAASGEYGGGW